MKIAIAISLVGAIVGELPTGAVAGLGARLLTGSYYGQTIQIWSALVSAATLEISNEDNETNFSIEVYPSEKDKCDRCWHHTGNLKEFLGSHICTRCLENVEGEGEKRKFF